MKKKCAKMLHYLELYSKLLLCMNVRKLFNGEVAKALTVVVTS